MRAHLPALSLVLMLAACGPATKTAEPVDAAALHEKLLVLDTHLDTPANFGRPGWDIAQRHTMGDDMTQVDLPRMKQGGLDGGFWVIYTAQGPLTAKGFADAKAFALKRSDEIAAIVAKNPDTMALATTADDAQKIAASGKVIVYQSIENSYPLGEDLSLLGEFYRRGVRMVGPVHSADNQFADSTTGKARWGGLSPLGKQWVAEMNRLGMVIDGSHSSDATLDQMLALSKTPIILSHSGPKAANDHPRNLDDGRIKAVAAKGGVIQINSIFLAPLNSSPERDALEARKEKIGTMTPEEQRKLAADFAALDAKAPYQDASFENFMASMLHVLKLVGADHVGMGADWDGGGGVKGMEDVSLLPKITARLLKEGYSETDIAKIMGGNTLRVLRAAEAAKGK
ncbi:dipeptidase [Sphingomonas colocasiae]|uniref:Dipeptidase n=1 Tax=Sphingomonas colocasiae TaxID=1848973 RepID=A0ABS7PTJ7_9SPHN|nr:dipeptidase [Sphingomonas colocasiae]MBY8824666.1 dipeptidase [Sphingomonas colocasiae]